MAKKMNKTVILTIAFLFSLVSWAQNDTIKNYYDEQKKSSPDEEIKNFYPDQNTQQNQGQDQPQPYYPQQNQQQTNKGIINKTPLVPESEFMKRLYFGSNINLQFANSNGYSIFNFDLSPFVGVKINDYFSAGLQVVFNNYIYSGYGHSTTYSIYGGGLFVRAVVVKHLLLTAEYDVLATPASSVFGNKNISGEKLIGIGYKSTLANIQSKRTGAEKPLSYFFCMLYDIAPDKNSPYYYSQFIYRVGIAYNW